MEGGLTRGDPFRVPGAAVRGQDNGSARARPRGRPGIGRNGRVGGAEKSCSRSRQGRKAQKLADSGPLAGTKGRRRRPRRGIRRPAEVTATTSAAKRRPGRGTSAVPRPKAVGLAASEDVGDDKQKLFFHYVEGEELQRR